MMRAWCYSLLLFIPVSLLSMQSNSKVVSEGNELNRKVYCNIAIPSNHSAFHAVVNGIKLASAIKKHRSMELNVALLPVICNDQDDNAIVELKEKNAMNILSMLHSKRNDMLALIKAERKECLDVSKKIVSANDEDICSMCGNVSQYHAWNRYNHSVCKHNACLECGIKFSSKEIITYHIMRKHPGKRSLINARIARMKNYTIKNVLQEMTD